MNVLEFYKNKRLNLKELKPLIDLFKHTYQEEPTEIIALKGDGSERKIYRLRNIHRSVIGIVGNNPDENKAFVSFTRHFYQCGLRVPEIYAENLNAGVYLEEDLGDDTLFEWMGKIRTGDDFSATIIQMYEKVLTQLPHFQFRAGSGIDYSLCYQHHEFGWASMVWDVHYFKHRFLDVFYKKSIDIAELERNFIALIEYLITEDKDYFLYRDFQSRNIMIRENEPHFIDYQSGRKGALQYDLASLLYDAKANIPEPAREHLFDFYLTQAKPFKNIDDQKFREYFYGFVFIRLMQALGAYGYLGVTKGKKRFLKSVPFAVRNLEILIEKDSILNKLSTLRDIFYNLSKDKSLRKF